MYTKSSNVCFKVLMSVCPTLQKQGLKNAQEPYTILLEIMKKES